MAIVKRIKQAFQEFPEQADIVRLTYGGRKYLWMLDMAWSMVWYGARPIDYVRFEFHRKSGRERDRYLTIMRYFALLKKMRKEMGSSSNLSGRKSEEYKRFSKAINRSYMIVNYETKESDIRDFITKYGTVIAKPDNGEQGHGVIKIKSDDLKTIQFLLNEIRNNQYIIEECLVNAPEISEINDTSLNTIRCYTLMDKDGNVHIMEIMLRVGLKGSVVDNWGSGGVGYCFDVNTGICCQCGLDKLNRPYTFHPGTNFKMIGFQLPNYDELKNYIVSLAKNLPEARYVGWDIAITPNGYELVEVNAPGGHDFLQAFGRPWGDFIKKYW